MENMPICILYVSNIGDVHLDVIRNHIDLKMKVKTEVWDNAGPPMAIPSRLQQIRKGNRWGQNTGHDAFVIYNFEPYNKGP